MPRIAFILQTFYGDDIGGAERQVQLLGQALQERGWETAYICERSADKPRVECVDGMDVFALPMRKKRYALLNYGHLKSAMMGSRADLYYQRVRSPYTGLVPYIARKLIKPSVFALASIADVIRSKDLFQAATHRNPMELILHPLWRRIEDWGILHTDAIVLQTQQQQQLLGENYGRSGMVIPNHIRVENGLIKAKKNPPQVLWVSNIKEMKRPELYLELARRCQDVDCDFVMAGACLNGSVLQTIKRAQDVLRNFRYMGPLDPAESERRIAVATLVVNTSEFEGFPNVLQQAWANSIPTLTLGIDPDDVIEREGLGGKANNLDELESMLRALLSDELERLETGERARKFALNAYRLDLLLPRYLELFDRLIQA
jgi:glycosyltransferase involved in cell wall biosynthesis